MATKSGFVCKIYNKIKPKRH